MPTQNVILFPERFEISPSAETRCKRTVKYHTDTE